MGAGLAGISLADALLRNGVSVCVIDVGEIASGASGTPLGLVNPATGRYGTKTWLAEECYHSIYSSLKETQAQTPAIFFRKSGVLRPALDEKIASKMKENYKSTNWPENWCQWLDEKEMYEVNKELSCVDGGIWLPVGLTVNISAYLKNKARILMQHEAKFITNAEYEITNKKHGFEISLSDGSKIQSANIIYTAGFDSIKNKYWDFLPLIAVKGQMATFKKTSPLEFDYAISALGYIASLSESEFVIGSTYEHNFEHRNPDKNGLEYLTKRMSRVYPSLIEASTLTGQWAGVRASTPNRKPILGQHPENKNLFIFTGLGSKGLLYSAYLSEIMGNYLIDSAEVPDEISIERF